MFRAVQYSTYSTAHYSTVRFRASVSHCLRNMLSSQLHKYSPAAVFQNGARRQPLLWVSRAGRQPVLAPHRAMQVSGVSLCTVQALKGGFLGGPIVLPQQEAVNNTVFVDLCGPKNAKFLKHFFMPREERKKSDHPERFIWHWPLIHTLKCLRREAVKQKELEEEQRRRNEERTLDLGFGAQENKKRKVLPLGKSQVVVVSASANGKSAQVRIYCRFRLKGLWVDQSKQTFDFLLEAFRHWVVTGGVSQPRRLPLAGQPEDTKSEGGGEEDCSDQDDDGVNIPEHPRWWRTMWIFKYRVKGASLTKQKSFSVRVCDDDDDAAFESRKQQRLADALEWRSTFLSDVSAHVVASDDKGGEASASSSES